MKLSISNIAWERGDDEYIYKQLKCLNYQGLEIAPTKIFGNNPYTKIEEAKKFSRRLWEVYNLEISSMQSIWYGRNERILGNKKEREFLIEYTKKAIEFAFSIGCNNLVFGCPKNRNINGKEDYNVAVEFFRRIAEYAYQYKIVVAMEANPVIYNTNFINDTASAIQLIDDVGSKGFMLNLDIGTMIENKESVEVVKSNIEKIHHVHISEPFLRYIQNRELHGKIVDCLQKQQYKNYISIEMGNIEKKEDINPILYYVKNLIA